MTTEVKDVVSRLRSVVVWLAVALVVTAAFGFTFGYAVDAGSRITPARLKLAETMDRSSRSTDRLIGTLDDMINMHCTWSKP